MEPLDHAFGKVVYLQTGHQVICVRLWTWAGSLRCAGFIREDGQTWRLVEFEATDLDPVSLANALHLEDALTTLETEPPRAASGDPFSRFRR
jgi:hypothetical protein